MLAVLGKWVGGTIATYLLYAAVAGAAAFGVWYILSTIKENGRLEQVNQQLTSEIKELNRLVLQQQVTIERDRKRAEDDQKDLDLLQQQLDSANEFFSKIPTKDIPLFEGEAYDQLQGIFKNRGRR